MTLVRIRIREERSDYCRTSLPLPVLYSNTLPLNSLGTVKQIERNKAHIRAEYTFPSFWQSLTYFLLV
jgi:hypothetical protein